MLPMSIQTQEFLWYDLSNIFLTRRWYNSTSNQINMVAWALCAISIFSYLIDVLQHDPTTWNSSTTIKFHRQIGNTCSLDVLVYHTAYCHCSLSEINQKTSWVHNNEKGGGRRNRDVYRGHLLDRCMAVTIILINDDRIPCRYFETQCFFCITRASPWI